MAVEGGTVSHYFILVIRKFIDFMSFSDIVCFFFLLNIFGIILSSTIKTIVFSL